MLCFFQTNANHIGYSESCGKVCLCQTQFLFKFGAEKARTLSFVSFIVPAAICFGVYEILTLCGVSFSDQFVFTLLCCSPLIALAWNLLMYKISYVIFVKKELLY